jgi:hypothetical protein
MPTGVLMGESTMPNLPPELELFSSLMDAQPEPVRAAFHYCLTLVMVESGKTRLVETRAGDSPDCMFETVVGKTLSLPRPAISREEEQDLIATLQQIINEEDRPWRLRASAMTEYRQDILLLILAAPVLGGLAALTREWSAAAAGGAVALYFSWQFWRN